MNKNFLAGIVCILHSTLALSETNYICLPDRSTGFKFNKYFKSWETTVFNTQHTKMLLKKTAKGWVWLKVGDKHGRNCSEMKYGYLFCSDYFGQIEFNKNSLRYIETYIRGYVEGEDNGLNTPAVDIGTCSPL